MKKERTPDEDFVYRLYGWTAGTVTAIVGFDVAIATEGTVNTVATILALGGVGTAAYNSYKFFF